MPHETAGPSLLEAIEQWRPIAGYEEYEVSNQGHVRYIGDYRASWRGRILSGVVRRGYRSVAIGKRGARRSYRVARLVAIAFIGAPPDSTSQINHKDCNKANDSVENLEWVTPRENTQHAIENGRRPRGGYQLGARHVNAKLTEANVREIRASNLSTYALASRLGVSPSNITMIRTRRTWQHVA